MIKLEVYSYTSEDQPIAYAVRFEYEKSWIDFSELNSRWNWVRYLLLTMLVASVYYATVLFLGVSVSHNGYLLAGLGVLILQVFPGSFIVSKLLRVKKLKELKKKVFVGIIREELLKLNAPWMIPYIVNSVFPHTYLGSIQNGADSVSYSEVAGICSLLIEFGHRSD